MTAHQIGVGTSLTFADAAVFSPVYGADTDTLYARGNDETAGTRNLLTIDTTLGNTALVAPSTTAYQDFAFIPE